MLFKMNRMKKNGIEFKGDKYLAQYRFNNAINTAYEQGGFREKDVLENAKSIEIQSHIYPGDKYVTADVYNKDGNGIQFIVYHETDRKNGYKPGDITG